MTDDAKRTILARRARFVAAALAGIGVACGKTEAPQPCLSTRPASTDAAAPPPDAEAPPEPCLSQRLPPKDAGGP